MPDRNQDFIGIGWAFPMNVTASGGTAMVRGEDTITRAIRLILQTYPGERPMRPEFGCRIRDYVFSGINDRTFAMIAVAVRDSLLRWEPRVDVETVDVAPDPEEPSLLYIDIRYTTKATNDRRNLVFPFYAIPDDESDY